MPDYRGEDAWLFAGDNFTGCSSRGRDDCPGCDYRQPKWKPTTNIIVLHTGGPTVLLFDTDPYGRFVVGVNSRWDTPELKRYAEVWQRLTPQYDNAKSGLKIRLANTDRQPYSYEEELGIVTQMATAEADADQFFGLSVNRGSGTQYSVFGTYKGSSWSLNLSTGEKVPITNLRVEDGRIRYTYDGQRSVQLADSIFNYRTGERIAHNPPVYSVMANTTTK